MIRRISSSFFQWGTFALCLLFSIASIYAGIFWFLICVHMSFVTLLFLFRQRSSPWLYAIVFLYAEFFSETHFGVQLFAGLLSCYVSFWLAQKTIVNRSWLSALFITWSGMSIHGVIWYFGGMLLEGNLWFPLSHFASLYGGLLLRAVPVFFCYFFGISRVSSLFREQLLFQPFYFWRVRPRI